MVMESVQDDFGSDFGARVGGPGIKPQQQSR